MYLKILRSLAQSWRELLVDISGRGLKVAPELTVGDGCLGFWKAVDKALPGTQHQRFWVYKTPNFSTISPSRVCRRSV